MYCSFYGPSDSSLNCYCMYASSLYAKPLSSVTSSTCHYYGLAALQAATQLVPLKRLLEELESLNGRLRHRVYQSFTTKKVYGLSIIYKFADFAPIAAPSLSCPYTHSPSKLSWCRFPGPSYPPICLFSFPLLPFMESCTCPDLVLSLPARH